MSWMRFGRGRSPSYRPLGSSTLFARRPTTARQAARPDEVARFRTPQIPLRPELVQAHATALGQDATDDASLVEALDYPVRLVEGDPLAFKITRPLDLLFAESVLADPALAQTALGDEHRSHDRPARTRSRPALAASGDAEAVGGGRAHRHRRPARLRHYLLGLGAAWTQPRQLADQLDGDVADHGAATAMRRAVSASSIAPLAPDHAGSDVPNWLPESPSPAADRSASHAAWATIAV